MPPIELTNRPLSILLVEDNPEDAFLLERHLRRNGFDPSIARVETAEQMLAAFKSGSMPDVVLADYNLPEFSGPAALSLVKELRVDIPFIMLSGAVTEEIAVSSMRAGAQDYVSKQNLARLVPALERELNERECRRREQATRQALRASESRFDRLVAAMPLGLLISDAENRIVYANGAMESMLQSPSASLRSGFFTLNAVFPDFKPFLAAVSGAEPLGGLFETTCKIRDGGSLEVLVGLAILNPEGSASARQIAVFVADLTLQKKSEETLRRTEKLAAAGRLAAAIAHEINNPLAALTNCLYLIAQFDLSDEPRRLLEIAQSELNRVSQITVQTLRFHRSSMHARPADLHELIETVLTLLGSRFAQQGIEVERRYGAIPHILMHDGEIRQLIANLVSNAVDALPHGGRIVIHTALTDDAKDGRPGVRLSVADNGIGMDTDTRLRIFEPFFSTKGTTGTGLGLWISREIAAKHGGRLRVRSCRATPGRPGGTVFTVLLRLDTTNAANAA
jgi:signal transduction histidine kinase